MRVFDMGVVFCFECCRMEECGWFDDGFIVLYWVIIDGLYDLNIL